MSWRNYTENDVCAICGARETANQPLYIVTPWMVKACEAHKKDVYWHCRKAFVLNNLDKLMRDTGVPGSYLHKTVRDWRAPADVKRQIVAYCESWPYSSDLVLHGRNNTGKTHLAAALLRTAFIKHYQLRGCAFVSTWKMAGRLGSYREREQAVAELLKPRLLILDDLSAEDYAANRLARASLFGVLDWRNARKADGYRTIVTLDQDPADAEENLGRRIVARLLRMRRIELTAVPARAETAAAVG
jgi:DNA replication protein DnaC